MNYFNPYPSFQNSTIPQIPVQAPVMQAQQMKVQNVNGINGAQAFPLAGDSSVLLLDSNQPIVWLVQTDSAGYKTCTPYDISPHKEELPVNSDQLKDLADRIGKLEDKMKEFES